MYDERLCFHRRQSVYRHRVGGGGGVTPSPSHNTSTGPMSFIGGTPVTGSRSLLGGTPWPGQDGVPPPTQPGQDGVPPPSQDRMGYPPPRDRTSKEYLLHGGQYASCVHAGAQSCLFIYKMKCFRENFVKISEFRKLHTLQVPEIQGN